MTATLTMSCQKHVQQVAIKCQCPTLHSFKDLFKNLLYQLQLMLTLHHLHDLLCQKVELLQEMAAVSFETLYLFKTFHSSLQLSLNNMNEIFEF